MTDVEKLRKEYAALKAKHDKQTLTVDTLEKRGNTLEKKLLAAEKQVAELLAVQENAEAYSNYKQLEAMTLQRDQYRRLFEEERAAHIQDKSSLQAMLAARPERIHNERGAGRKPILPVYIKAVIKLKKEQPSLSLRGIASATGLSHMTVSRILQQVAKGEER